MSILYDAAYGYDTENVTYDGRIITGTGGWDALFRTEKPARLSDVPKGEVDPRGYMTGRLLDDHSFWL